jgi:hypothetical protein
MPHSPLINLKSDLCNCQLLWNSWIQLRLRNESALTESLSMNVFQVRGMVFIPYETKPDIDRESDAKTYTGVNCLGVIFKWGIHWPYLAMLMIIISMLTYIYTIQPWNCFTKYIFHKHKWCKSRYMYNWMIPTTFPAFEPVDFGSRVNRFDTETTTWKTSQGYANSPRFLLKYLYLILLMFLTIVLNT